MPPLYSARCLFKKKVSCFLIANWRKKILDYPKARVWTCPPHLLQFQFDSVARKSSRQSNFSNPDGTRSVDHTVKNAYLMPRTFSFGGGHWGCKQFERKPADTPGEVAAAQEVEWLIR